MERTQAMVDLRQLVEFREIEHLKYRYLRGLDTHQWDLLESCFVEDAHAWYSGGSFTHHGRAEIVGFLKSLIPPAFVSSHIVTHPELKLTGPDTAEGIWRLQDVVYFKEPNPVFTHGNIQGGEEMTGAGYYYDEYRKEADGWKISSTGYVRIYEVIERKPARAHIDLECDPSRGLRSGPR
jgi:hypothetical protein